MSSSKIYSGIDKIPKGYASEKIVPGCLVLEGGAFRGLYSQGVMDAFMENDINIQTVIGVSAGAMGGMNYVSGQIGRSARVNLAYRRDSRYVGLKAFMISRSILNLSFPLGYYNKIEPLDERRLSSPDRHFIAVATSLLDGKPKYYDKDNCSDIVKAITASASMPYISPVVDVDGTSCLDGGCSCKIAYEWALENNFEKILIVKTRERGFRKEAKESSLPFKFYKKYKEFAKKLSTSDKDYNKALDDIDELEKSGRAYVLAPSEPVTVGRVEKDMEKLGALYWLGYNDALNNLQDIKSYLGVD